MFWRLRDDTRALYYLLNKFFISLCNKNELFCLVKINFFLFSFFLLASKFLFFSPHAFEPATLLSLSLVNGWIKNISWEHSLNIIHPLERYIPCERMLKIAREKTFERMRKIWENFHTFFLDLHPPHNIFEILPPNEL